MASGFVLKRTDDGLPVFFTLKVGHDFGAGQGGWSTEQRKALRFGRASDAKAFAEAYLKSLAPFCQFEPIHDEDA